MECAINVTMKGLVTRWEKFARLNKMSPLTMFSVHAMSWMPDLTVFCSIFSWLKHFKIPPARIVQSRILDSKVINAFSAPWFLLWDARYRCYWYWSKTEWKKLAPNWLLWAYSNDVICIECIPLLKKNAVRNNNY